MALKQPKIARHALQRRGFELFERRANHHYVPDFYGRQAYKLRSPLEDEHFAEAARLVIEDGLTLLHYDRLHTLYQSLAQLASDPRRHGCLEIAEIGVYRGGTLHFFASLTEHFAPSGARVVGVDTFEGHSSLDFDEGTEGAHKSGKFAKTDYEEVASLLAPFSFVEVLKGRIQDVANSLADRHFDFVHVDVDIYRPTVFSLEFFAPRMDLGGIMVVDDYGCVTCPGVKRAVDKFCADRPGFVRIVLPSAQCLLVKAVTDGIV